VTTSERLPFVVDDGGRRAAGFPRPAPGDCAARAVAIATELSYLEAHDAIRRLTVERHRLRKSDPDRGVYGACMGWLLEGELGWGWRDPVWDLCLEPRLQLGDVPAEGPLIVAMRRHFAAVVDGVVRDTWDPGGRPLRGYWRPPA
jgi:hypothetical protein